VKAFSDYGTRPHWQSSERLLVVSAIPCLLKESTGFSPGAVRFRLQETVNLFPLQYGRSIREISSCGKRPAYRIDPHGFPWGT